MQSFEWANAATVDDAIKLLAAGPRVDPDETPRPMGGGQDLLTTMKSYITRPPRVVNLKTIRGMTGVEVTADAIKIGALTTLTDLAADPGIVRNFPGLVDAVHSIATPQIRNMGTVGGNLGQRPRCWYFRLENIRCLKRGGDTCYAKEGENKYHAIFGNNGPCVMVHPSDLAPIFKAVDAVLSVNGPAGKRDIPIANFFVTPIDPAQGVRLEGISQPVRVENVLGSGEIITGISIPLSPLLTRSAYIKFKERESLDFAMASVAAALSLAGDGSVKQARVVLGGVAPVPWRLNAVEDYVTGKRIDPPTAARAGEMAVDGATPLSQNKYKLRLVKTLVARALMKAAVV